MADGTSIEWTDATLNVVNGCSVHSPGCTNCYAMRAGGRNLPGHPSTGLTKPSKAGHVWTGEVRFNEAALLLPLRWKRRRRIFWNAHGDLFHENVPDEWIDRCFAVMALTPQHQHQVLTKRSARMRSYLEDSSGDWSRIDDIWHEISKFTAAGASLDPDREIGLPLPNVWLGVSVEDQQRADERIPDLFATPAAVRWLSCEPLLGPVDLKLGGAFQQVDPAYWGAYHARFRGVDRPRGREASRGWTDADMTLRHHPDLNEAGQGIRWVVVGGESGKGARPMHPDWVRSLRDQCATAGVPFLFKQWGEWAPGDAFGGVSDGPVTTSKGDVRDWMNRYVVCEDRADRLRGHSFTQHSTNLVYRIGKKRAGRLLDGVQHDGFPQ